MEFNYVFNDAESATKPATAADHNVTRKPVRRAEGVSCASDRIKALTETATNQLAFQEYFASICCNYWDESKAFTVSDTPPSF